MNEPAKSDLPAPPPELPAPTPRDMAVAARGFAPQQLRPQSCGCGGAGGAGCSCGAGPVGFVYAIGSISARFPSMSIEREFMQVWSPTSYTGSIPQSVIYEVLSQGQNLYLAREMCWVFSNEGVDMYLVTPRSYVELTDLIMALAPTHGDIDYDLIVGTIGPIAPPQMCNGLQLPVVSATQVFTFSQKAFLQNIVDYAAKIGKTVTLAAAENAFNILIQLTDNAGSSNEQRAINYLTFKSIDIYVLETLLEQQTPRYQLTDVSAQPSALSGTRQIVDVIFVYTNTETTNVEKYFARVDVTGMFPFLVTGISRFYDRPI